MLTQASIAQYKSGSLKSPDNHLVITMRFYPRFLRSELRDEFISELAPAKELLRDFNEAQKRVGHNGAFAEVDYENRFRLDESALQHLERLAKLSATKDVYLACICDMGEMCHREILMLAANELFNCEIGHVYHSYPTFMKRVKAEFSSPL